MQLARWTPFAPKKCATKFKNNLHSQPAGTRARAPCRALIRLVLCRTGGSVPAARLALLLLEEALGVEGARRSSHASQDRKRKQPWCGGSPDHPSPFAYPPCPA